MQRRRSLLALATFLLISAPALAQQSSETKLPQPTVHKPIRFEALTQAEGIRQTTVTQILQDRDGFLWFAHEAGVDRYDGYKVTNYSSDPFDTTSLQQGTVRAMIETGDGSIWMGAANGAARYNRETDSFEQFKIVEDEVSGFNDGSVLDIEEDAEGQLWFGTFSHGLRRMNPHQKGEIESFRHKPADPTTISHDVVVSVHEDPSGRIWVGTWDGLNLKEPGKGVRFERYLSGSDPQLRIFTIHDDPSMNHVLWLGTSEGLMRFDTKTAETTRYLQAKVDGRPVTVAGITQDPTTPSVFWVATGFPYVGVGYGLVRFDSRTGEAVRYSHNSNDPGSVATNDLFSIYTDRSGIIWAGAKSVGVVRFDPSPGGFIHYRHIPGDPTSLPPGHVWAISEDARGGLWITTSPGDLRGGGYAARIDRLTGVATPYRHDPNDARTVSDGIVVDIAATSPGDVWLLMANGRVNRLDGKTGAVRRFRPVADDQRPIQEMREDAQGRLWFRYGQSGRRDSDLVRYDPITETFTSIEQGDHASSGLDSRTTTDLLVTGTGAVWVATTRGLYEHDAASDRFIRHARVPADTSDVTNSMRFISEALDGSIWGISSSGGYPALAQFDPSTKKWKVYEHISGDQTSFNMPPTVPFPKILQREREPDILWVAYFDGLMRLDLTTGVFKHFSSRDGLVDKSVYAIKEDAEGRFWMSSNSGVHMFDPDNNTFRNYDVSDGLQANEFNGNSDYKSPRTGEIFFGGINGITAFSPEQVLANSKPPDIRLTDFRLFNQPVKPGAGSPLEKPIGLSKEIHLSYDQNSISFDFVGLHFKNSVKNQYRYRLKGFDEEWVEAGTQRSAAYTNLDPGEYTFEVLASNSDGAWAELPATVQLTILPPWWKTAWAYGLYVLLIGASVFAADRVQRRRLIGKERERAAIEQAELRARSAEAEVNEAQARAEAVEAQTRALEAENESRKNVELLSRIGQTITASLSTEEIVETVYESVNDLMDASIFGVGIYRADDETLHFPAMKEKGESLPAFLYRLDDPNRLASWCFKNRKEIVIHDYNQEATKYIAEVRPPVAGEDPESILYIPLMHRDRAVGVITAQSFEKNAYDEHDANVLRTLATYVAIAMDNAEAYTRLHATVDELNQTLSQLQSAQTQLVTQEKLASLGSLTAGIAHEIKNPLNFVNNFAEVTAELARELAEELREKKEMKVADILEGIDEILTGLTINAAQISRHGQRADRIVKNMMDHARGGKGERYPVDLNAFVDEYVSIAYHGVRAQRPDFNVQVERDFDPSTGSQEIAPQEMGRVLINLMNNAFDAVHERAASERDFVPRVRVLTRNLNGGLEIRVEDNGPGIVPDLAAKIFEPFFTTKPAGSGTGLGLSLSYDIVVHRHGGQLHVGTGRDGGAAFVIRLNGMNGTS